MRTSYNQANQLTTITGTGTGTITGTDQATTAYTYDATGLRASATTTTGTETTTEQYTWNAMASVPQLLTDATHAYLYGNTSTPLAQYDLTTGGADYLHTDLLGSIRTTTNHTGAVTSDADYDTYGQPLAVTTEPASAITRFGYAGEYTDPTGYIYLRARYYDPTTAQFLTRDPLEATTNNPYGYTDGNPLQYTDPLGLDWLQNLSDFSAGFGDTITLGGTKAIRELINYGLNGEADDMVNGCSGFYKAGSVTGVAGSLPTLMVTGPLAVVYAGAVGSMSVKSSVSSFQEGHYIMGTVYGLTALPSLGVATSGIMHQGANAMNRVDPGSVVRNGTWWATLGRKADPAASMATGAVIPFQVASIVCNAKP